MPRYTVEHIARASCVDRYLIQNAAVRGGLAFRVEVLVFPNGLKICRKCGVMTSCVHKRFVDTVLQNEVAGTS